MRRFLLVDDEINVLHALRRNLRHCIPDEELQIEIFTEPEKALVRCSEVSFDIVISDYRMPTMSGIEFLKMVKTIQPNAVRLVLSASTEFEAVVRAINQAEVFRYIAKPWQADEVSETIRLALVRHDESLEEQRLLNELRAQLGQLTPQEMEAKRLEKEEPGITKVKWGPDGSVILDE